MPHGQLYYNQIRSGGANVQTSTYTLVDGDAWKAVIHNSGSSHTFNLPATIPSNVWSVTIANIGAGVLTLSPNGLNLDGSGSSIAINQNQGVVIFTDGSNYFSDRGTGGSALTIKTNGTNNGSQSILNLAAGTGMTLTDNGTGTVTFASSGGGGAMVQLAQVVCAANQTSVHFSTISGAYTDLLITFSSRSQGAVSVDALWCEINSDTTVANYETPIYILGNGTSPISGTLFTSTQGLQVFDHPGANATANVPGTGKISIMSYAKTTFWKRINVDGGWAQTGNDTITMATSGIWKSTAAITDLIFTSNSLAAFVNGSVFTLYGIS